LQWLNAEAYEEEEPVGHGDAKEHRHDVNRHSAEIGSFCLKFDGPLHWEHVANWLDSLVICHSDDLLRVKGILNIVGREKPIVVQAVQRLFHPPFELPQWPSDDRSSRIVFITRGLSRDYVADVFATIRQRKPAPDNE
jgi:G3E family GTPase